MLLLHQQKTDDAQKIQEEPMKRNTKRVALTAAAIALLSLHLVPAGELSAAAYQQAAGRFYTADGNTSADEGWNNDGRHYKVTTQTDPLNLRAEPSQAATIITAMPKGTIITVLQTRDGWAKVQYGSVIGYCAMEWLTVAPDAVLTPENNAKENEKTIYRYLTQTLGLTSAAACGILGNMHVETGGSFDPTAHDPDNIGYGICQWNNTADAGYRVDQLRAFTSEWNTVQGQLEFLRNDLLHNDYLLSLHLYDELKAFGNTEEDAAAASDCFARKYEGCASYTFEMRREKARFYYGEHAGSTTAVQWNNTAQTRIVATESGGLNMRASASIFDSILLVIPKGAEVSVKSISNDGRWANVEYRGVNGYCVTEYLKEPSAAADTGIKGDLNGNKTVGADDAQLVLNAYADRIAGKSMGLTDAQIKAADVNGDGQVSVEDAQLILQYYTAKYVSAMDITWEQLLRK